MQAHDMLDRVLARLPPAGQLLPPLWRRAAAESRTCRTACVRVTARDPWFLMLEDPNHHEEADDNAGGV